MGAGAERYGQGMGGMLRQWIEKKGLEKYFRRDNLILLVLAGILLFVIALPVNSGNQRKEQNAGASGGASGQSGHAAEERGTGDGQMSSEEEAFGLWADRYAAEQERRLAEVLSEMEEVGEVRVMITLRTSEELVVERELSVSGSTTEETDAQGGSRRIENREREERVVYGSEEGENQPYVIKSYVPQIEGVLVVAQGAGSGTVNRTVTEIVQALFHIEAHKIMVVKMRDGN